MRKDQPCSNCLTAEDLKNLKEVSLDGAMLALDATQQNLAEEAAAATVEEVLGLLPSWVSAEGEIPAKLFDYAYHNARNRAAELAQLPSLLAAAKRGAIEILGLSPAAEDVMHCTVEKLCARRLAKKKEIENPEGWCYVSAKNLAKELKQLPQHSTLDENENVQPGYTLPDSCPPPDVLFERDEVRRCLPQLLELIQKCINNENSLNQRILHGAHWDLLTHREVSAVTGLSEDAVRQRYSRSLKNVRECLRTELRSWAEGNELFSPAVDNPDFLEALLELVSEAEGDQPDITQPAGTAIETQTTEEFPAEIGSPVQRVNSLPHRAVGQAYEILDIVGDDSPGACEEETPWRDDSRRGGQGNETDPMSG